MTARAHPRRRPCPACESLEPRWLLSGAGPTAYEQYLVALINRARADPAAEARRLGIALDEGLSGADIDAAARPPLVIDLSLLDAARRHSRWMLDNQMFSHTGDEHTTPRDRMNDAGFDFGAPQNSAENLAIFAQNDALASDLSDAVEAIHANLFVDRAAAGRGHRLNLLDAQLQFIGAGLATGSYLGFEALAASEDLARSGTQPFVTGVVYDDRLTPGDADDFYSPGEGLGGVTIAATRQAVVVDRPTLNVAETGTGTFNVQLGTAPAADVVVRLSKAEGGDEDLNIDVRTITITAADWHQPHPVVISAEGDVDAAHGSATFMIEADGLAGATVAATEIDDEPPRVSITATDGHAVALGPDGATFMVTREGLTHEAVTVALSLGGTAVAGVDYAAVPAAVTIEAGAGEAVLAITPLPGAAADADRTVTLTLVERPAYALGSPATASATIHTQALVVDRDEHHVAEGGEASFTVRLLTAPQEPLTVDVRRQSGDRHLTADPRSLTFDATDWAEPRTIWIRAEQDTDTREGRALFALSGPGLFERTVTAHEVEDDQRLVLEPSDLVVAEGATATFTVRLGVRPVEEVVVQLDASGASDRDLSVDTSMLTFTDADWHEPRTITVSAAPDGDTVAGTASLRLTSDGVGTTTVLITEGETDTTDTAVTWDAGGYALPLPAGVYTLTATGAGLAAPRTVTNVVVDEVSVNLDFRADTTADLVVDLLGSVAGDYGPGNLLPMTMAIENRGAEGVEVDDLSIAAWLSSDAILGNDDDVQILDAGAPGSVGGGTLRVVELDAVIPLTAAVGMYHLVVAVDADGMVPEADDGNNTWWSDAAQIQIASPIPAITLTGPTRDMFVYAGAAIAVTWTDSDGDDDADVELYLDTDHGGAPWLEGSGVRIAQLTEDADGAGDHFTLDTTGIAPGTYAIWGRVSDGTDIAFSRAPGLLTVTEQHETTAPSLQLVAPAQAVSIQAGEPGIVTIAWIDRT